LPDKSTHIFVYRPPLRGNSAELAPWSAAIGNALADGYRDVIEEPLSATVVELLHSLNTKGSLTREPSAKLCHIVCECGSAVYVTLEVLDPSALKLRCLSCCGDRVTVRELRRAS
jgi:hypothetical protein